KIDILVTPAVTILIGVLVAELIGPAVSAFMTSFGNIIMQATTMQPIIMGALVSALVGIALTLPISSAAICMMLSLGGLAGGAAT
ncbi:PTS sugar transporter subunit IID, partial [Clostridioides difficile]